MTRYSLAYGHEHKEFELDSNRVLKEVHIAKFPEIVNLKAAILESIYHPIGREPIDKIIKPGQKIAFICNDPTRVANTFDFMPVLVNEMNKLGVKDEDMFVIFALGTHRNMTREEMVEAVGPDVGSRVKLYNSDSKVEEDFQYFGETSRKTPVWFNKKICNVDHIFMTGSIVHHFFCGYGGGRKAILPGVAAMETIRMNHSHMLEEHADIGVLHGNPCYEDQMEAVSMFAKGRSLFLFNCVLDAEHHFLKIFAGDYDLAHQEACKFVDEVYGVDIPETADIVISSCGGYPKDINVYQMQKTMNNAWCAVREGGVVIMVAECIEGSGSKPLEDTCREYDSADKIKALLEKHFAIGVHKAFAVTRLMQKAKFILVSALNSELAKTMEFSGVVDSVPAALKLAEETVGKDYKIIIMPEGGYTVPLVKDKN
ncbi:MAG: nickel-dependent lactate racemase [Acholeplasmataceae bacterium]|nr:nickel-dependent lactate racemase [Acholeplasmataceae bacterium]